MEQKQRRKKVLWFSVTDPTPEQVKDAEANGWLLIVDPEVKKLAATEIKDQKTLKAVVSGIQREAIKHADDHSIHRECHVLGDYPVPLHYVMAMDSDICLSSRGEYGAQAGVFCFSEWRVNKAKAGKPPVFTHKDYLLVGEL
jgi:hypothetical protein